MYSPSLSLFITISNYYYRFASIIQNNLLPSVLWRCGMGVRKGIQPVKTEWWGTGVVICLQQGKIICIWSSWCHCHHIISSSSKIQNGLPSWCRLTQVVLEKRPLNRCSSSSSIQDHLHSLESQVKKWEYLFGAKFYCLHALADDN